MDLLMISSRNNTLTGVNNVINMIKYVLKDTHKSRGAGVTADKVPWNE
jgi:hypothetical protein